MSGFNFANLSFGNGPTQSTAVSATTASVSLPAAAAASNAASASTASASPASRPPVVAPTPDGSWMLPAMNPTTNGLNSFLAQTQTVFPMPATAGGALFGAAAPSSPFSVPAFGGAAGSALPSTSPSVSTATPFSGFSATSSSLPSTAPPSFAFGSAGFGNFAPPAALSFAPLPPPRKRITEPGEVRNELIHVMRNRESVFHTDWSAALGQSSYLGQLLSCGLATESRMKEATQWVTDKIAANGFDLAEHARLYPDRNVLMLLTSPALSLDPAAFALPLFRVLLKDPSAAALLADQETTLELVHALIRCWSGSEPAPASDNCWAVIELVLDRSSLVEAIILNFLETASLLLIVRTLRRVPSSKLRATSLDAITTQSKLLSERHPFVTPMRLCREVCAQWAEWQGRESSADAGTAASREAAGSSMDAGVTDSSDEFHTWLASFESGLPSRLEAPCCLAELNHKAGLFSLRAPMLDLISRFDLIDWAETMFHGELFLLLRCALRSSSQDIVEATLERVLQLHSQAKRNGTEERGNSSCSSVNPAAPPSIAALVTCTLQTALGVVTTDRGWSLTRDLLLAAQSAAASPSLGLSFDCFLRQPSPAKQFTAACMLVRCGLTEDVHGMSVTDVILERGSHDLLHRWLSPANAELSMPLGWLTGGLKPRFTMYSAQLPLHPHLDAADQCDAWNRLAARQQLYGRLDQQRASSVLQHAIDWHYATVTPRLREALSPHLIPDLHAEVMSFLMPAYTRPEPSATVTAVCGSSALLQSALQSLQPEQHDTARLLRQLQHQLGVEQVERAYALRAMEAEWQLHALK